MEPVLPEPLAQTPLSSDPGWRSSGCSSASASCSSAARSTTPSPTSITAQLLYLEGEDPEKDIWLYINSPGGSVTAGMAIYDTMQFVSPTSAPSAWAWARRWASSCCAPARRASATRCRTPAS